MQPRTLRSFPVAELADTVTVEAVSPLVKTASSDQMETLARWASCRRAASRAWLLLLTDGEPDAVLRAAT
jgi:hypothetical protein